MTDAIAEAEFQRAQALQHSGHPAQAAEIYARLAKPVLTLKVALNLGLCMGKLGRRAEAEHWLGLVARTRPDLPGPHRLLGSALAASGKADEAERELLTALKLAPQDDHIKLALADFYLSRGRYAEGWPLMAARIPLHPGVVPPVKVNFPEWRGEPLAGKSIMVWVEQGFGDQIQMSRFANALKDRGAARVSLACRPALADLFGMLRGVDAVIPVAVGEGVAVASHDYWSRPFSLPEHLGTSLANLPADPYLAAPADRRDRWPGHGGVGLAWKASPTGFNAAAKSLDEATAARLLDRGAMSLHPEDSGAADFADTAAIIAGLDLVISIDTAVAHLAGAMGKRCWTLIPYVGTDWRWLRDRDDSPWYPSMTLYRQTAPGTWEDVLRRVLADWPG